MTDSIQKIIDDMYTASEIQCDDIDLREFAVRLEALQKQPVAWMESDGGILLVTHGSEAIFKDGDYGEYNIPLIRAD